MMKFSRADQLKLLKIQEHDAAVLRLAHEAKTLPQLQEIDALKQELGQLQATLEQAQTRLAEINAQIKSMDEQILAINHKLEAKRAAQMRGEGLTSRDLLTIEEEIAAFKTQLNSAEDAQLEKIGEKENLEQEIAGAESRAAEIKITGKNLAGEIKERHAQLAVQAKVEKEARQVLAAELPDELLKIYEECRANSGGIGIRLVNPETDVEQLPLDERVAIEKAQPDDLVISAEFGYILLPVAAHR